MRGWGRFSKRRLYPQALFEAAAGGNADADTLRPFMERLRSEAGIAPKDSAHNAIRLARLVVDRDQMIAETKANATQAVEERGHALAQRAQHGGRRVEALEQRDVDRLQLGLEAACARAGTPKELPKAGATERRTRTRSAAWVVAALLPNSEHRPRSSPEDRGSCGCGRCFY